MQPPPPCYWELYNTVEKYLTNGSQIPEGFSLDALEEGETDKLTVYPYARKGEAGAHFVYNIGKLNTKVRCDWTTSANKCPIPLPYLSTSFKKGDLTYFTTFDAHSGYLNQACVHPVYFLTGSGPVYSLGSALLTASTRLWKNGFIGGRVMYDGKRSGIKNADVIAVQRNCPNVYGGDLMARYSLSDGMSLQVRVPVHQYMDVAVIGDRKRFIAGVQARSPCGARLMLSGNVTERTFMLNMIRNMNDIWKITISYTAAIPGCHGAPRAPRFGIRLTNQDSNDYTYM